MQFKSSGKPPKNLLKANLPIGHVTKIQSFFAEFPEVILAFFLIEENNT